LYYCGQPVNSLLEGETRQVETIWRLQQFDFWVREPGHLALALLRSYASAPDRFAENEIKFREAFDRMLVDDQADIRRVKLTGTAQNFTEDLDASLSFLTARSLVSDRPSFARSRQFSHQIVLEAEGVKFVQKIFDSCPTFAWYRDQAELVATYFTRLEHYDLTFMSYLTPELNPATAATVPLIPYIRRRMATVFGEISHVNL
jgi:hypothetical protein